MGCCFPRECQALSFGSRYRVLVAVNGNHVIILRYYTSSFSNGDCHCTIIRCHEDEQPQEWPRLTNKQWPDSPQWPRRCSFGSVVGGIVVGTIAATVDSTNAPTGIASKRAATRPNPKHTPASTTAAVSHDFECTLAMLQWQSTLRLAVVVISAVLSSCFNTAN